MTGTPSQIEWAETIKPRVGAEFDRVAKAFAAVARRQQQQARTDTQAVIAILEEKRAEVMAHEQAGYFIRDWQELGDQVRRMIGQDSRYGAIQARKAARALTMRGTKPIPPALPISE
jgi:acyl-CoA reductase-like NAD-dependent aldehyde dehydrogenase